MKSFHNWDIYYLYEYAYSFKLHGDGEPLLILYEDENTRFCYVVMKQDIAGCKGFNGKLEYDKYYDLETPYGYGGPLSNNLIGTSAQRKFLNELTDYCNSQKIVSQFVRFHPLLSNQELLSTVIETRYLRDTIFIDTESPEVIMKNMDSKNRNMIRKAVKNGVSIQRQPIDNYQEFLCMYKETMLKDNANDYYTFDERYFESLKSLEQNACIFYALLEEKLISGAIMYFNEKFMHYHLAGTHTEYRQYSPNNLLLYEAGCWASKQGIKQFHLGGGMKPEDSLFGFKKQFNKYGRLPFFVGRTIFNKERYKELCRIRKKIDPEFDESNSFMIQYRR